MTMSQVLDDGVGLRDGALGGLENGEPVGGVEGLVCGSLSLLLGVDDEGEVLASELGDSLAGLDEDVTGVLGVEFLKRNRES